MSAVRSTLSLIALTVAVLIGTAVLVQSCTVATTVATAPGRVVNKTLGTDNIITSYEWFYDANAAFEGRVSQIKELRLAHAEEVDPRQKSMLRVDLSAVRQSCRDLATKYNANSEKMNKQVFKSKNLPSTLSLSDCEA